MANTQWDMWYERQGCKNKLWGGGEKIMIDTWSLMCFMEATTQMAILEGWEYFLLVFGLQRKWEWFVDVAKCVN